MGRLSSWLLGISPIEATAERRGFREATLATARERLEAVGRTFLHGYNAALLASDTNALGHTLDQVEPELRGFAYEGGAMALTLLDHLAPWKRNRFRSFLQGPGRGHVYMLYVGAGWALARLPRSVEAMVRLDPLLGWLAVDGCGFHQGYFSWRRYIEERQGPTGLSPHGRHVFDQGLGRSLWFVEGAQVERIARTIRRFRPERQADLWSGVGLACAYAGGVSRRDLEELRMEAGRFLPELAQGVSFAAKARALAHNMTDATETAAAVICRKSAAEAAAMTDDALTNLAPGGAEPAYALWRHRIQARYTEA